MMSSDLASVESLQFLLQHMDANRRFEISTRCPALRAIEKSVPLMIDSLTLMENRLIVNDTTYKIGIVRKHIVGEQPEYVVASNENGGVSFEVDAYGIRDELDRFTVTPGDVRINLRGEPRIPGEDARITSLQNEIHRYEIQLAQLQERRPNRNLEAIDYLKMNIEIARAKLIDHQHRWNNIPSNYEHFLQLTKSRIVDKQEQKTIQRYVHNKKFSEAVKQLTTVLFGGRSSPIHVTKFKFCCMQGVIRLPIGLKFHVDQLMFTGEVEPALDALAPILEESSYPLKELEAGFFSMNDVTRPIVATSGILRIRFFSRHSLQTIPAITNSVVHFSMSKLSEQTLEALLANWIELQRPIGTEHTFHFYNEPVFADEMEDILKRPNGVAIDDESVIIPMSDATQLKVSYGPFPLFAPRSQWAVRFSTVAIEH